MATDSIPQGKLHEGIAEENVICKLTKGEWM